MKPSELIRRLKPFCLAVESEEPEILVATEGSIMPVAPDTISEWNVNKTSYITIHRRPREKQ